MEAPGSEQESQKLLKEIMDRFPRSEINAAEIKFYGIIGDAMKLARYQ